MTRMFKEQCRVLFIYWKSFTFLLYDPSRYSFYVLTNMSAYIHIDKNAATKLTDDQLKSMGQIAIGDIVMLESFSDSPQKSSVLSPLETMNRTSRTPTRGRR